MSTSGASVFVSYELLASLLELPEGIRIAGALPTNVGVLNLPGLDLVLVDDDDRLPYAAPGTRVPRLTLADVTDIVEALDDGPRTIDLNLVKYGTTSGLPPTLEELRAAGLLPAAPDASTDAVVTGQQGPPPAPPAAPTVATPAVSSEGAGAGTPERPLT